MSKVAGLNDMPTMTNADFRSPDKAAAALTGVALRSPPANLSCDVIAMPFKLKGGPPQQ